MQPSQAVQDAIAYAYSRGVVLAAAAADEAIEDQGYPASLLQPTGTGPDLAAGRGLSVTAADATDQRASFAGRGSQISLAAYGSYGPRGGGPRGIFGAFTVVDEPARDRLGVGAPAAAVPLPRDVRRRRALRLHPGHLDVDADGRRHRRAHAPPEPGARGRRDRARHQGRRAPARRRGLERRRRLGILDAGAALARARDTDRTRAGLEGDARAHARARASRSAGRAPTPGRAGVRRSGLARYELWRSSRQAGFRRVLVTRRRSKVVTLVRGRRYRFYSVAVDHDGNREAAPARPDVTHPPALIRPGAGP